MRASDRAYTALRDDILSWRLPPGSPLAEVEQSRRLGVSRTPLREALARLAADGLARQLGGRGTVVSDVTLEHLDDLFELRLALETAAAAAAARAAARAPDLSVRFDHLAQRLVRASATTRGPSAQSTYDVAEELETAIDDAAANPYLARALAQLRGHLVRLRRLAADDPARLRSAASEHAAVARSIAAGDPDLAAAATRLHLAQAQRSITDHAAERLQSIERTPV
ncbi:GntR family transcriptional regulator [Zhihengliuella flava]|uniref:DNA-binding GntR family transcriptional regulator n=1 Tax=Zhihengliuella flava TaxID=1285193 RepID=A0A931GDR5_9MICC|nr:GntR family transcriptional regulator [Zhihengliuella flava]MBG6083718.1 DNA-binding GntR family transcriptional regulator [Zhihengliuella flava]